MNHTNEKSYSQRITPPITDTLSHLMDELNEHVIKCSKETNSYNLSNPDTVKISQELDKELIKLINTM